MLAISCLLCSVRRTGPVKERRDTLRISGFVDDVIFAHSRAGNRSRVSSENDSPEGSTGLTLRRILRLTN